jgi:hypothetical protein
MHVAVLLTLAIDDDYWRNSADLCPYCGSREDTLYYGSVEKPDGPSPLDDLYRCRDCMGYYVLVYKCHRPESGGEVYELIRVEVHDGRV